MNIERKDTELENQLKTEEYTFRRVNFLGVTIEKAGRNRLKEINI